MAEIKRVGVVGAGLMGHGIAQVAAEAGYDVVLRDIDQGFVDKGRAAIDTQLRKAVEKGKKSQEDADAALARVTGTTDLATLADRDIVVEAIPEVLDVKRALWAELDLIAAEHTIFATNTSALSVIDQAAVTQRPDASRTSTDTTGLSPYLGLKITAETLSGPATTATVPRESSRVTPDVG